VQGGGGRGVLGPNVVQSLHVKHVDHSGQTSLFPWGWLRLCRLAATQDDPPMLAPTTQGWQASSYVSKEGHTMATR
jgi:hypothetical protein